MNLTSSKKLENSRHELEISVGAEEFKPAVDKAFKKNAKKISIPGFRKGKAPRAMIERMYGEGVFYEDAVNELYPIAYEQALEESGVQPVDRAEIDVLDVSKDGFSFKATFTVKPEVEVKDYKGIKADKLVEKVSAEEVDAELSRMQEQGGRMVDIDSRPAQLGDTATIDFEGFVDGVAFEGGKGDQYPLSLGSNQFIPGFEEQIVGKKLGDEFEVNVTFPEDYHAEELKGKPAVFKVKLHELKMRQLPELDDEFVKDVSEFDTLDELKIDIEKKLQEQKDHKSDTDLENALVDVILENLTADIPAVMVENRIGEMLQDFDYRLQSQGLNLDAYAKYTGSTTDMMRESFREQAERQVKVRLALEKIAELEKLAPTDEEIDAEYKRLAEQYKIEEEKVRAFMPAKEISQDLSVNKAIDFVREHAAVTEKSAAEKKAGEGDKPAKKSTAKKPAAKKTEEGEKPAKKPAAKKTAKKEEEGAE